jgi:hypothetical protein
MPNARRTETSLTVTLTNANQNYSIYELAQAITSADSVPTDTPGACRELNIQSHPGIAGSGSNTADILVGDSQLSTTRIGYVLPVGGVRTYRSTVGNVNLAGIYVRSATAGQKLNLEIHSA